ncbi:MAG TPA: hypothetical protein VK063_04660 [Beutenbergiaceae bacterium]|nr:hypothetical protein [Beutenbergiaceae bacterium]
MIVSRPVRFTGNMAAHRGLLEALGGRILSDFGTWVVYSVGYGRIALHTADESSPAGSCMLGFEADDIHLVAASAQATAPWGTRIRITEATHGTTAMVTAADGLTFTIDALTLDPDTSGSDERARDDDLRPSDTAADDGVRPGQLAVLPLWLTGQTEHAVDTLVALGARERVRADSGNWVDLRTDAGLVAVHRAEHTAVTLSFEYAGDVEKLIEPLRDAGHEANVIDEPHGRTLRVPDPDLDGAEVWINQTQSDLYTNHGAQ